MLIEAFFKEFDNAMCEIPDRGPVLLACGPHSNQLVDSIVVLKSLSKRIDIGFLTARKTMRSKYFSAMARTLRSIPVERPQDKSTMGTGKVTSNGVTLRGHEGTKFTSELTAGDTVMILMEDGKTKLVSRIKCVIDDSTAELRTPTVVDDPKGDLRVVNTNMTKSPSLLNLVAESKKHAPTYFDVSQPRKWKVVPKLDQSLVFKNVIARLQQGGVVGIFPEGGSHDNPHLLPLKAGISFMALEFMKKNPGVKIPIIPVGINYFNGHRFRSRVYIETGEAIYASNELLKQYCRGGEHKRAACVALLEQVRRGMQEVTVETPDRSSFEFIQTVRRLYTHTQFDLSAKERHTITKAFADRFSSVRHDPRLQRLYRKVLQYRKSLHDLGMTDSKVAAANDDKDIFKSAMVIGLLVQKCLLMIIYLVAAVPALVLATPVVILTRYISRSKAQAAVRKSSVKLTGRDVIATWKLMVALIVIPLLHIFYTVCACFCGGEKIGVAYFYFAPFVSLAGIRCFESSLRVRNTIKSLTLSLRLGRKGSVRLLKTRRLLQREVRDVATALGWDRKLAITQPDVYRNFSPLSSPRSKSGSGIRRNESYGNFF